jgi:hypothetical protein
MPGRVRRLRRSLSIAHLPVAAAGLFHAESNADEKGPPGPNRYNAWPCVFSSVSQMHMQCGVDVMVVIKSNAGRFFVVRRLRDSVRETHTGALVLIR